MARKNEIVTAVDFGSRAIRALIGKQSSDGTVQIVGHGAAKSRGCITQGVIQDLNAAQQALRRALSDAEKEAGTKTPALFCGINGKNVDTFIREGAVKLDSGMVELGHMDEALDLASRDILAAGKRVVSSITSQEWYLDDLRVGDPIGLRGSVLRTRVHFAQIPSLIEDNLVSCIESQGRDLEDVVFLPLAAGLGCLTPEDMELGVAVMDMGHTTTGLAVYRDGRILGAQSFEWGGFHITRDVAAGLQVSFEEAAELVLEYGISERYIREEAEEAEESGKLALAESAERTANIKLKTAVRGAPTIVERNELDMIVFERSKELMTKARQYLRSRGLDKHLVRGVVLTGGAAAIRRQEALAEAVFQVPAHVGQPENLDILPQPVNAAEYVPAIGVIRHGFEYRAAMRSGRIEVARGPVRSAFKRVGSFVSRYFF